MRFTGSIGRRNAASRKFLSGLAEEALDGVVVCYSTAEALDPASHECVTRLLTARKLAALKGYDFGGEHDTAKPHTGAVYYVPGSTLVGCKLAARLGILSADDLFGGVVPYPFVGTKTITHPLVDEVARAPEGWSYEFPEAVRDAVLEGYAAFSREDALRAGYRLMERGAVRVKPALALGGNGQTVVASSPELEAALDRIDREELTTCGVTLEQNLTGVETYSVGQVRVAGLVATYYGTQRLATNNRGEEVYGGSELVVVRGDFDALLKLDMPAGLRRAVAQAQVYDDAAHACFAGFFASRRNYDIAEGLNAHGERCCGVLEQSWRIGGASGAEIAALERFRDDPDVQVVRSRTVEVYGADEPLPPGAVTYFRGIDEKEGFLTKYTVVDGHVDT